MEERSFARRQPPVEEESVVQSPPTQEADARRRGFPKVFYLYTPSLALWMSAPNGTVWKAAATGVVVVVCLSGIFSFVKGDPEQKRQQKLEARRQHIREMEEDLGYEPLNLEELDPIFEEIKREKEK